MFVYKTENQQIKYSKFIYYYNLFINLHIYFFNYFLFGQFQASIHFCMYYKNKQFHRQGCD